MPRRLRRDYPGAWHHVMDRGVARRTLFESGRDVRTFLAHLARQVRAGDIEIHVFSVLTTHFHILLRSPRGRLSAAMQRALDGYARWFNRTRRRDGPLFRGRFTNRLVQDENYLAAVIRYIDRNPVEAGLASRPEDHPYGSARHYIRGSCPPWLSKGEILRRLSNSGLPAGVAQAYRDAFGSGLRKGEEAWLVERGLRPDRGGKERTRRLLQLAPASVRERFRRKSILADGEGPDEVILDPVTVRSAVRHAAEGMGRSNPRKPGHSLPLGEVLECGALRLLSGLKQEEIAERLVTSPSAVRRRLECHERFLKRDRGYARAFHRLLDALAPRGEPLPPSEGASRNGTGAEPRRLGSAEVASDA